MDSVTDIGAQTGLLGVIGHPISHSLSPRLHNAAFRSQGLNLVYLAFDVLPKSLSAAIEGLRALRIQGANVTVPHKEAIVSLLDRLDPLAQRIGAVNTIVCEDGWLVGHNTDVEGFRAALHSVLPSGARGRRCLLAGAGGAARAVAAALVEEGAAAVWVYNRTRSRAEALCADAMSWGARTCEPLGAELLAEYGCSADIVINATSIGIDPDIEEMPFSVDILSSHQVVFDLVYGVVPTLLLREAAAKGAATIDGLEMLLMQAASSYRLWTGLNAPLAVMRHASGR